MQCNLYHTIHTVANISHISGKFEMIVQNIWYRIRILCIHHPNLWKGYTFC
jgi:hypothetical protein